MILMPIELTGQNLRGKRRDKTAKMLETERLRRVELNSRETKELSSIRWLRSISSTMIGINTCRNRKSLPRWSKKFFPIWSKRLNRCKIWVQGHSREQTWHPMRHSEAKALTKHHQSKQDNLICQNKWLPFKCLQKRFLIAMSIVRSQTQIKRCSAKKFDC